MARVCSARGSENPEERFELPFVTTARRARRLA
jgi:hypothetical protein